MGDLEDAALILTLPDKKLADEAHGKPRGFPCNLVRCDGYSVRLHGIIPCLSVTIVHEAAIGCQQAFAALAAVGGNVCL